MIRVSSVLGLYVGAFGYSIVSPSNCLSSMPYVCNLDVDYTPELFNACMDELKGTKCKGFIASAIQTGGEWTICGGSDDPSSVSASNITSRLEPSSGEAPYATLALAKFSRAKIITLRSLSNIGFGKDCEGAKVGLSDAEVSDQTRVCGQTKFKTTTVAVISPIQDVDIKEKMEYPGEGRVLVLLANERNCSKPGTHRLLLSVEGRPNNASPPNGGLLVMLTTSIAMILLSVAV